MSKEQNSVQGSGDASPWPYWGTCVDCPEHPRGSKRPWECVNRDRYDHRLSRGLEQRASDASPAAILFRRVEAMNARREEDPDADGEPEETAVIEAAQAWAKSAQRAEPALPRGCIPGVSSQIPCTSCGAPVGRTCEEHAALGQRRESASPTLDRLESEIVGLHQDLAFAHRDHSVTIRRARRFELGLGTVSAMLLPDHPAQGVIAGILADPEDPATQQTSNPTPEQDTK